MPGNGLALAVRVGGQEDGIGLLGGLFQILRAFSPYPVMTSYLSVESVLDIDAEFLGRKIYDMTAGSAFTT